MYQIKPLQHRIWPSVKYLPHFAWEKLILEIKIDGRHLMEYERSDIMGWLYQRASGNWCVWPVEHNKGTLISFEHEEDAVLFKLVWANGKPKTPDQ